MISRNLILGLLAFQIFNAEAFDVCNNNGFEKDKIGWIRTVSINQKVYVDFKVNIDELEEDVLKVSLDIAPILAKDAASNAYYRIYKSISSPPFSNADLIYKNTEAFASTCRFKKTYGYRTPLSTFQWVEPRPSDENDLLPPVRNLLKRKQLID